MTHSPTAPRFTATAGDDVMTVHRLDGDGLRPACGADGELTEWRRAVTCADCLRPQAGK